jgi:ubiquinone/menaquinone biosynthesis C-methylase UbiE
MSLSISFDQIAAVYDAQRAHPPEVATAVGQAIAAVAGNQAPLLELGVGTGRIALPTAAAGCPVIGIDVSREMLAIAAGRANTLQVPLHVVQADAQQLPFADASFAAAVAVHVLHLFPDWRQSLVELRRVIRPGGAIIQGVDWRDPDSCVGMLRGRLRMAVMELLPGARPPGAGAAIPQALQKLGGVTAEPLVAARWERAISPAFVIDGMAARNDPETWVLADDLLSAALANVRDWAAKQWPDLDAPQAVEHRFTLTVTRFA